MHVEQRLVLAESISHCVMRRQHEVVGGTWREKLFAGHF